mmetsp:Transcript_9251/g.21492  ORF Transcript_9251/g.21492 Transcript_9251/m.21492 type:complete len:277 (-) Transcript_9251:165-995(-)
MRRSKRRRTAGSRFHGTLVAPSTSTFSATSLIRTSNSFLRRRDASDSSSERVEVRASTSSMKMIDGRCASADAKSARTCFSDSPTHLLTRSELQIEKKVASTSAATAFARCDLPVPGGPYKRMPRHGLRSAVKSCGNRIGSTAASCSAALAASKPATSSHRTFGFDVTMAPSRRPLRLSSLWLVGWLDVGSVAPVPCAPLRAVPFPRALLVGWAVPLQLGGAGGARVRDASATRGACPFNASARARHSAACARSTCLRSSLGASFMLSSSSCTPSS